MVQYLPVVVAVSRNKVKTYSEAKIVPKSWARLKLSILLGSLSLTDQAETRVDLVTDSLSRKLSPYLWTSSIRTVLLASPSQGVSGNGFTHRELGQLPDLLISPLLFGSGNGISREAGWISGTMDLLPSLLWQRSHSREGCPSKLLKVTTWNISFAVETYLC